MLVLTGSASALNVTEHVVQPGETLAQIAERYGFPIETLMDVNGIKNPDNIQAGQVLKIPGFASDDLKPQPVAAHPGKTHTVVAGDTLSRIAAENGVSVTALKDINGLERDLIFVGQVLKIPGAAVATEAPPLQPAVTYTVKPGDTLSGIAGQFGVPAAAISEANGVLNPNAIFPGQVLTIPGAAPAAGPAAPQPTVHIVQEGETLARIAAKYGVPVKRLGDANNLADHDVIHPGERLVIPNAATPSQTTGYASRTHTVAAGETLGMIAERYTVPVKTLMAENTIKDPNLVFVGQVLRIPGPTGGAEPPPPAPVAKTYVVRAGDTVSIIAAREGVSIAALVEANALANPNNIREGQVLTIPGGSSAAGVPDRGLPRSEYARILQNAAAEFGVRSALIKAVAWQESGWNQWVVSSAQAVGLMQVTPYTAEWALLTLVPDATGWRTSPVDNARMGTAILHHWLVQSGGDEVLAIAAYFQGWRSLQEIGMYEETKVYVASVRALIAEFE